MKPDNAGTGLVIGQFGLGVVDSADPDMEPEVIPLAGTVTFTPNVPYLPNPTADPNPITIVTSAITAVLDSEGYVCTPGPDGVTPFYRGVRLFATNDPDLSVENWTWSVVYTFQPVKGIIPKIPAHSMPLLENETVDLATVVPVPASPGIGTPQALALLQQAVEAAGTVADAQLLMQRAEDAADRAEAPTDAMMANTATNPSSQFSGVLVEVIDERTPDLIQATMGSVVGGLVAESLAADPTVANAAAAAVDANPKIASLEADSVSQDGRIGSVEPLAPMVGQILDVPTSVDYAYSVTDETGKVIMGVTQDATPTISDMEVMPLPNASEWAYAVTDEDGTIIFGVRHDGSGTAGGDAFTGTDVILLAGQSNMQGAGRPLQPAEAHPRVFQYPASNKPDAGKIIPAIEPLQHRGIITSNVAHGPGMEFALRYAERHPSRRVLLVPAAVSGSGFTPTANGCWQIDTTEPIQLGNLAIQQTQGALAAAGDDAKLVAIVWHQGEADGGLGAATYQGHLDALFSAFRTRLGYPDVPIVVGQMNPERTDSLASARDIEGVHMDTPRRFFRSAFAYAPRGAHNVEGDVTHFSANGVQILGASMFDALTTAQRNLDTVGAGQVTNLRGTRAGDQVTVRWDWPHTHVTGYRIEQSADGATWTQTGVTQYKPLDTGAALTAAGPVQVRITVLNGVSESIPQVITI